jgi:hypothetical protein
MKSRYYLAALVVLMISGVALASEVALTVYVHQGDLNGTLLSGVEITGEDAKGSSFDEVTGSDGTAVINGQPGTWKFKFTKNGYDALELNYDVTETDEGAVYLTKTAQS